MRRNRSSGSGLHSWPIRSPVSVAACQRPGPRSAFNRHTGLAAALANCCAMPDTGSPNFGPRCAVDARGVLQHVWQIIPPFGSLALFGQVPLALGDLMDGGAGSIEKGRE